jgi:ABC-type multidrug transport system fused ATPase/permease subunit
VVLNKGRVVQVGSPEKLETVGGLYKDLVYRVNQLP